MPGIGPESPFVDSKFSVAKCAKSPANLAEVFAPCFQWVVRILGRKHLTSEGYASRLRSRQALRAPMGLVVSQRPWDLDHPPEQWRVECGIGWRGGKKGTWRDPNPGGPARARLELGAMESPGSKPDASRPGYLLIACDFALRFFR